MEAGCDTLMDSVNVAVEDLIASRLWEEFLQPRLCRRFAHHLFVALARERRENGPPRSAAVTTPDLEKVCPFIRIGEIRTKRHAMGLRKIKPCRQHKKAFGEGVTFELDIQCFADC